MTADAATQGIREMDPHGTIGLIGAEPVPPYNRPPLSKGLWKGDSLEAIRRDTAGRDVADWREPHREGVLYYLRDGRVRGVLLWNVWGQVDAARRLIAEPGPFSAANLRGHLPE